MKNINNQIDITEMFQSEIPDEEDIKLINDGKIDNDESSTLEDFAEELGIKI